MGEEIEGDEIDVTEILPKNFKSKSCREENGKIVCEGVMDNQPTVCEVSVKDGKPDVNCRPVSAV